MPSHVLLLAHMLGRTIPGLGQPVRKAGEGTLTAQLAYGFRGTSLSVAAFLRSMVTVACF